MYPAYMHDWAQADRLSLALNFYDEGMDFFKPRTNNLGSTERVSGVEFPIQSYTAAALGFIFGREHISTCFRLLDIIISCTGLFFLFLTCYRATKNFILSAFPPLFLFCSPVYVFYSGTYMPDTAATSITFIAFYYIFSCFRMPNDRKVLKIAVLLTLAGLIKTSAAYCLTAFAATVLICQLTVKDARPVARRLRPLTIFIPAFGIIIAYYFYNQYLNKAYYSFLFFARINPFTSREEVTLFYDTHFMPVWMKEYFLPPQYFVLGAMLLLGIFVCLKVKQARIHLLFLFLLLLGSFSLLWLFGKQLFFHDYYIIAMVQPTMAYILLLPVVYGAPLIKKKYALYAVQAIISAGLLFFLIPMSVKQAEARNTAGYLGNFYGVHWTANPNIKKTLDSVLRDRNTPVSMLDEDPPNLSLIYLDRKGINIPNHVWADNIINVNSIMNDWRVRIMVCRGSLGKRLHETHMDSCCFTPIIINDEIAVFWKKRLPPLEKK